MTTRLLERVKARLIDDCARWWRLWSVRIHLAALAFAALYEMVPAIPAGIAAVIPPQYSPLLLALYPLLGIAARLIKQKSNG